MTLVRPGAGYAWLGAPAVAMITRLALVSLALVLAACGFAADPDDSEAAVCDRVAATGGSDRHAGTQRHPFRTAQRLANSLRPGQTGCLRAGTYDDEVPGGYVLKFFEGGKRSKPLTIRSFPGERATLKGVVYFPKDSPRVRLSNVNINGRAPWLDDETVTVQMMAAHVTFSGNRVTNHGLKSCMIMGSNSGWGRAVDAYVHNNVFSDCGNPAHGMLDHGIYVENALRSKISDNVFYNAPGYAIHLYPNAQQTDVEHNVMADNGGGVIFGGDDDQASSGNLVRRNVITGSHGDYGIAAYWGGPVGRGNVARANCVFGNAGGQIEPSEGFRAVGNLVSAPGFVNAAVRDYRLLPGSACARVVGAGIARSAGRGRS
jgi:parallel beta helix pectate lyase-like protein